MFTQEILVCVLIRGHSVWNLWLAFFCILKDLFMYVDIIESKRSQSSKITNCRVKCRQVIIWNWSNGIFAFRPMSLARLKDEQEWSAAVVGAKRALFAEDKKKKNNLGGLHSRFLKNFRWAKLSTLQSQNASYLRFCMAGKSPRILGILFHLQGWDMLKMMLVLFLFVQHQFLSNLSLIL